VILRIYADESGTNDRTGKQYGSSVPTVCGYIQTPEYWGLFSKKWKRILNDYHVPYFHFRELVTPRLREKSCNPYNRWSEKKIDGFIHDLAFLCSQAAIPIGGCFNAKLAHALNISEDPFKSALELFFEDLKEALSHRWPSYTGRILFVFDRTDSAEWTSTIHSVYKEQTKRDSRFGGLTFEDDKDPMHVPLQAADLYAYSVRQYAERALQRKRGEPSEPARFLDFLLMRLSHPMSGLITLQQWTHVVRNVRQDRDRQMAIWKRKNIKQAYWPLVHHPALKKHNPLGQYGKEK
jgi:hypothetical protein